MTTEVIVGGVFALLGALVGVIAGVIGERYARRIGSVHSAISGWKLERGEDGEATYVFSIKVFNEMDLNTGARDVHVVFFCGDGSEIASIPEDKVDGHRTDALNFQSRTWLTKDLRGEIDGENAQKLGDEYKVELRGALHTGAKISQEISTDGSVTTGLFKENRRI